MPLALPLLPYPYGALEPTIDELTMRLHYDKHHGGYVAGLNAALEGTAWAQRPVEELLGDLDALPEDMSTLVRNNGGGHLNHSLFLESMAPVDHGPPADALAEAIEATVRGDAQAAEAAAARAERQGLAAGVHTTVALAEDLGVARARAGAIDAAIEAFDGALVLFTECGATWDAGRVRRRLRDHGVRRRLVPRERAESGWASMTDSELAVARLVAQGLTNREVAERLFVSPHTVSSHLRSVFAKLDINSRLALTRIADEHH